MTAEREIEHAHNAGTDRGGVLDLKRRHDISSLVQPKDVNQPDGGGARMVVLSWRPHLVLTMTARWSTLGKPSSRFSNQARVQISQWLHYVCIGPLLNLAYGCRCSSFHAGAIIGAALLISTTLTDFRIGTRTLSV